MGCFVGWGTPLEVERKRRIDVAVYAYAYEILNESLVEDHVFDQRCLAIQPTVSTGNRKLDNFFKKHFEPHTGMWVHKHPDKAGLLRIVQLKRGQKPMTTRHVFGVGEQTKLARQIGEDLNAHTAQLYDGGHRNHMGASMIGDECSRKLWYNFRWCYTATYINAKGENHKGRMMRLFNRGHKEEHRFNEWLRGMGFIVEEYDSKSRLWYRGEDTDYVAGYTPPEGANSELYTDVTDDLAHEAAARIVDVERNQFRISGAEGHYGGSTDGRVTLPPIYGMPDKMLLEYKTSGVKAFTKLKKDGVIVAKPVHFAQMSAYGSYYNLSYALYMCVCKDTDEVHIEIVKLDWDFGVQLGVKAERIITAKNPPPKLSENSAFFSCKFCDFSGICHGRIPYEKNCRSCANAQPIAEGKWSCAHYGVIPPEHIKTGCPHHVEAR